MPIITKRKVSNGVAARLEKVWDVRENCHEIGVMAGKTHVCVKVNELFARCQVKGHVQIFRALQRDKDSNYFCSGCLFR
nr:MAG TPA: hypothetical protein [Caudoviricetes sp.]